MAWPDRAEPNDMRVILRCLLAVVVLAIGVGRAPSASAQSVRYPERLPTEPARHALVIGNANYSREPLLNPENDANAMASLLFSLGFEVTRMLNFRRDEVGASLEAFANRIGRGDSVVVFYAGHGLQVRGENYLLAIDANLRSEFDVALNGISVSSLLARIDERGAGVKILLLDACRNNPYAFRNRSTGTTGLARMGEFAPSGTLIGFSTRPGGLAEDGDSSNSLFVQSLLQHLASPGVAVETALKRVQADVYRRTQGRQEPWMEGGIRGDFVFAPAIVAPPILAGEAGVAPGLRPSAAVPKGAAPGPVASALPVAPALLRTSPQAGGGWSAQLSLNGDRMQLRGLSFAGSDGKPRAYACVGQSIDDKPTTPGSKRTVTGWLFDGRCSHGGQTHEIKANRHFLLIGDRDASGPITKVLRLEAVR